MSSQAGLLFFDYGTAIPAIGGLDGGYIYRAGGYEGVQRIG